MKKIAKLNRNKDLSIENLEHNAKRDAWYGMTEAWVCE